MHNWTSPILQIRFDMSGKELKIFGPDGSPYLTYQEVAEKNDRLAQEKNEVERQRGGRASARRACAPRAKPISGEPIAWPPSCARWESSRPSKARVWR